MKPFSRRHPTLSDRSSTDFYIAEVLPENIPMLRVFERSGFGFSAKHGPGFVHVTLRLV